MTRTEIPLTRPGGFPSLEEAKAHRSLVAKLMGQIELARSVADDWREADKVEVGSVGSELYRDLAPGQGHVVMLTQPEGAPLMGAELRYDPADGSVQSLVIDQAERVLSFDGSSYTLVEGGVTTRFSLDEARGVLTVWS